MVYASVLELMDLRGVWHVSGTHERSNLCPGYPLSPPYPWFHCAWSRGNMSFFSNIYAPIDPQGKLLVWNNIHLVRSLFPYLPWIIAGDFNAILDLTEKRGGNARLEPSSTLL